jgi:hypothetical protein
MSRNWIWLLSLLYLAAAIAFAAYEMVQNPFWKFNVGTIGETVGAGLAVYGTSAALPLIAWGLARFRQQTARPVFVAWLIIGITLAYFVDAGKRTDRTASISKLPSNSVFSDKDRGAFEQSVKLGCEQTQRANPLTAKIGISEAKITVYCECMSVGLAEAISPEELRYAVSNGKPPASLLDKREMMGQFCIQEALRN